MRLAPRMEVSLDLQAIWVWNNTAPTVRTDRMVPMAHMVHMRRMALMVRMVHMLHMALMLRMGPTARTGLTGRGEAATIQPPCVPLKRAGSACGLESAVKEPTVNLAKGCHEDCFDRPVSFWY